MRSGLLIASLNVEVRHIAHYCSTLILQAMVAPIPTVLVTQSLKFGDSEVNVTGSSLWRVIYFSIMERHLLYRFSHRSCRRDFVRCVCQSH
jgi:hypothetical protein